MYFDEVYIKNLDDVTGVYNPTRRKPGQLMTWGGTKRRRICIHAIIMVNEQFLYMSIKDYMF